MFFGSTILNKVKFGNQNCDYYIVNCIILIFIVRERRENKNKTEVTVENIKESNKNIGLGC